MPPKITKNLAVDFEFSNSHLRTWTFSGGHKKDIPDSFMKMQFPRWNWMNIYFISSFFINTENLIAKQIQNKNRVRNLMTVIQNKFLLISKFKPIAFNHNTKNQSYQ